MSVLWAGESTAAAFSPDKGIEQIKSPHEIQQGEYPQQDRGRTRHQRQRFPQKEGAKEQEKDSAEEKAIPGTQIHLNAVAKG